MLMTKFTWASMLPLVGDAFQPALDPSPVIPPISNRMTNRSESRAKGPTRAVVQTRLGSDLILDFRSPKALLSKCAIDIVSG